MSHTQLRAQCLFDENCGLVVASTSAEVAGSIVGHAFYTRFKFKDRGYVTWVTQLCVDANHRGSGVAKRLCAHAWSLEKDYASGLVSSHPHAVRALEKVSSSASPARDMPLFQATGRSCDPKRIARHAAQLVEESRIPYVQGKRLLVSDKAASIDTGFFVDHTEVDALLDRERAVRGWDLGPLYQGHEFLAFTFPGTSPSRSPPSAPAQDPAAPARPAINRADVRRLNFDLDQDAEPPAPLRSTWRKYGPGALLIATAAAMATGVALFARRRRAV